MNKIILIKCLPSITCYSPFCIESQRNLVPKRLNNRSGYQISWTEWWNGKLNEGNFFL